MKKYLFLVATILLTVSMSVSAQNYNNRRNAGNRQSNMNNRRSTQMMRMSPQERVNLMTKELNLTDKEASEVLALCEKQEAERMEQMREHRSQRGMGMQNRDNRRQEFREMREQQMEKHYAELEKIIGEERAEKWNDLRQDVRDANRIGRMNGRGDFRNNQRNISNRRNFDYRRDDYTMRMSPKERATLMTEELDLTKEQTQQILSLSEKHEAERIEQIRAHRSKRGTGPQDRDARRQEFRELREKQMREQQAELEKIIGEEKLEQWNNIRQPVRDDNRAERRNPRYSN